MSDLTASESTSESSDPFLKTLAALKSVIQPDQRHAKQIHILQKENRTLFEKLEALRQESEEQLETLQQMSQQKLEEQQKKWEQTLQSEREQSQKECNQLAADLAKSKAKLNEIEQEKKLVLERAEEEQRLLAESMIQLESENKSLKERCAKSAAIGAKVEAELNERTYAYEQSKVAMVKIRGLLSDAESNAAELSECKQKIRDAQSNASDLQYKLQQKERELTAVKAKVALIEQEAKKQFAELESKLVAQQAKAEEEGNDRMASVVQQLDEKNKAYVTLQEQVETETMDLRNKLSTKGALLKAKEEMLKLVTAKSESLQKKEIELKQELKEAQEASTNEALKHEAEMASLKEQLDEVKDELMCAEDEVTRCRKGMASVSELQSKLEQTERELAAAKAKAASMEQEVVEVAAKCETKLTEGEEEASIEQQLEESRKAYSNLQEQMQAETRGLQSKLSAKDALLEAKEKKIKLVTAKSESLQKREVVLKQDLKEAKEAVATAAAKHTAEAVSWNEEIDQLRDKLRLAEKEVLSIRETLKEANISDEREIVNIEEPAVAVSTFREVVDNKDVPEGVDNVQSERKDGMGDRQSTAMGETSKRNRPAEDTDESISATNEPSGALDSMKSKLLAAKSRRNKKTKTEGDRNM